MTLSPVHQAQLCEVQGTAREPPSDPPLLSTSSSPSFLRLHGGSSLHVGRLSLGSGYHGRVCLKHSRATLSLCAPLFNISSPASRPVWPPLPGSSVPLPLAIHPTQQVSLLAQPSFPSGLTPPSLLGCFPVPRQTESPVFTGKPSGTSLQRCLGW